MLLTPNDNPKREAFFKNSRLFDSKDLMRVTFWRPKDRSFQGLNGSEPKYFLLRSDMVWRMIICLTASCNFSSALRISLRGITGLVGAVLSMELNRSTSRLPRSTATMRVKSSVKKITEMRMFLSAIIANYIGFAIYKRNSYFKKYFLFLLQLGH